MPNPQTLSVENTQSEKAWWGWGRRKRFSFKTSTALQTRSTLLDFRLTENHTQHQPPPESGTRGHHKAPADMGQKPL